MSEKSFRIKILNVVLSRKFREFVTYVGYSMITLGPHPTPTLVGYVKLTIGENLRDIGKRKQSLIRFSHV